jgi:hypothetical protein
MGGLPQPKNGFIRPNGPRELAKVSRGFPAYKYKINQYTGEGYSDNSRIR